MIMNLTDNRTGELWRQFMPRLKELKHRSSTELLSLQLYDEGYFDQFEPGRKFEKWALAEVSSFEDLPDGLESFTLSGGLYAIFHYKGMNTDPSTFRYIYSEWLPSSNYSLDNRPHFELLGAKYNNNHPDSEEDIYIPVRMK
jgi:AraC family transcriptional regulator